jgi:hypothetical protein
MRFCIELRPPRRPCESGVPKPIQNFTLDYVTKINYKGVSVESVPGGGDRIAAERAAAWGGSRHDLSNRECGSDSRREFAIANTPDVGPSPGRRSGASVHVTPKWWCLEPRPQVRGFCRSRTAGFPDLNFTLDCVTKINYKGVSVGSVPGRGGQADQRGRQHRAPPTLERQSPSQWVPDASICTGLKF